MGNEQFSDSIGAQEPTQQKLTFSFTIVTVDLLGILGFACSLSWFLLMLMNPLLSNIMPATSAFITVLIFILGELIGCVVSWAFAKRFVQPRVFRVILVLIPIFTSAPAISSLFGVGVVGHTFLQVIWLFAGISLMLMLGLWGFFLAQLKHRDAVFYPAASGLFTIIFVLFVLLLLPSPFLNIAMILLPCMSILFFIFWLRKKGISNLLAAQNKTTPPDWKSLFRSAIAMVANGYMLGFVYLAVSISPDRQTSFFILLGLLAAVLYKLYDSKHRQAYEVHIIIRIIAPTIAFCLLSISLLDVSYWVLFISFMGCIAVMNEIVCWSAVSEYMHVYRLLPFSNIGFGRMGNVVGVALGYMTGFVILGGGYQDVAVFPPGILINTVVIVMVFVQAFLFRDNYQPFSEHKSVILNVEQPSINSGFGAWHKKIFSFAENNSLTPAQTRVLFLLAKGYSTAHIEEELVVSRHTIKAHVYAIYRRCGVHSRQELIDSMEQYKLIKDE